MRCWREGDGVAATQTSPAGPQTTNRALPRDPAIPHQGTAPKELEAGSQTDICTFTGSDLAAGKRRERPRVPRPVNGYTKWDAQGGPEQTHKTTHGMGWHIPIINHCAMCHAGTCKRGLPQAVHLEWDTIST